MIQNKDELKSLKLQLRREARGNGLLWLHADNLIHEVSVLEDEQGGNATDAELG